MTTGVRIDNAHGKFSVKSAWQKCRQKSCISTISNFIWHQSVPLNWSFSCCNNLQVETIYHLFVGGPLASKVWNHYEHNLNIYSNANVLQMKLSDSVKQFYHWSQIALFGSCGYIETREDLRIKLLHKPLRLFIKWMVFCKLSLILTRLPRRGIYVMMCCLRILMCRLGKHIISDLWSPDGWNQILAGSN